MEQTLLFDELEIKSKCSNEVFKLGKKLLAKESIQNFLIEESVLSAQCSVDEKSVYTVSFCRIDNRFSTYCDCQQQTSYCEHVIALCLHYLEVVSPKKLSQRVKPIDYTGYKISFLREAPDEVAMSRRLDIVLELKKRSNEYSFYFIDNQSNSVITESFFFLFDFEKLIENEANQAKKRFYNYFYRRYGEQFFYPHEYFTIDQELVLSAELFSFPLYNKDHQKYRFSDHLLSLELHFALLTDIVRLQLLVLLEDGSKLDVSNEFFGQAKIPFLLSKKVIYFFKHPSISPLITTFQKQAQVSLDIAKFTTFLSTKVVMLKEKGLKVVLDPHLIDLKKIQLQPRSYFKIKVFNEKLYLQLHFMYQSRKLLAQYKHMYLMIDNKGSFCQRNITQEQEWNARLLDMGFKSKKSLFVIEGDLLYDFIKYCFKQKNQITVSSTRPLKDFLPQASAIQPLFSFSVGSKSHLIRIQCQFFLNKALIGDQNFGAQLENRQRYFRLGGGLIYEVYAIDIVHELIRNAEWKADGSFFADTNIGLAMQICSTYPAHCKLNAAASSIFELKGFDRTDLIDIPPVVCKGISIHRYQKVGINWLYKLNKSKLGGILADDMGLGKTLQALALLKYFKLTSKSFKTCLIVMPTTLLFNWEYETKKYYPDLNVLLYEGASRKKKLKSFKDYDLVFCSYAILRRDILELKKESFYYVILDEAQAIKNLKSKTSQSVVTLKCKHRLALSGTPIENRVSEIWSLFNFLIPNYLGRYDDFRQDFEIPIQQGDKRPLTALRHHIRPLILRRIKENIAVELPAKNEHYIYCDLSKPQEKMYKEFLSTNKALLQERIATQGIKKAHFHILSLLTHLRQICCHPRLLAPDRLVESHKFELLKEMVEQILEGNHKIVIFSQFVKMLMIIKEWMIASSITHEILTGQTVNRKDVINRFNSDENVSVILVSLRAGGTGINLTAADYIFHYDPWWNPAVENQATDRVHRIGQDKPVFVYKMITKGTVEDKICAIQNEKHGIYKDILDSEYGIVNLLNDDELKRLLAFN